MLLRIGLLFALFAFTHVSAEAAVTATVDRNQISEFDLLTLTIRVTDRTNVEPDWRPLEKDFAVVNQQSQQNSSISLINGRQTARSYVDYQFTLRPKRQGALSIPAITVGTERTNPITVMVLPQSAALTNQMRQILFFETLVDRTDVYVQAQLLYTVRLYYADSISGDFPGPPILDNAVVEIIENEKRFETIVNNRRYYVLEKQYAIFPQASGTLELPPESFVGTRGRGGLFSARERINAVSEGHTLRVKPVPRAFQGDSWLPAKTLTLETTLNRPDSPLVVGDAINQVITVRATGITGALLPQLAYPDNDRARIYIDQPVIEEFATAQTGITAESVTTIGIVPTAEGTLSLPPLSIYWWDTESDQQRIATLDELDLAIGASRINNEPLVQAPPAQEIDVATAHAALESQLQTLMWLVASLFVAWVLTFAAWLRAKRPKRPARTRPKPPTYDLRRLNQALKRKDAQQTLQELQFWRQHYYPDTHALAELTAIEPALKPILAALESAQYRPAGAQSNWDPNTLQMLLERLSVRPIKPNNKRTRQTGLDASLNPSF